MDPSNFNIPGRSTDQFVTEQDLISKLDHEKIPGENRNAQVDCTLKLGVPSSQNQSNSMNCHQPQQPNMYAASSQMGRDYGNVVMAGRVNANHGSPGRIISNSSTGGFIPYGGGAGAGAGGPSVPVPVICNNYGNLYYMNPQNNVAVNNNIQAAARIEAPVKKCMVCQASSTPLWRKGPDGEKSLCNACGIRYRKDEKKKMAPGDM